MPTPSHRPTATPPAPARPPRLSARTRAAVRLGVLAALGLAAGCALPTGTTGNNLQQPIYAVLYGHVTAPKSRTNVTIEGRAYTDSLDALAFGSTAGYVGGFTFQADTGDNFNQTLLVANSGVYFLTVLAYGQGPNGLEYSSDTAYAVHVRFDSVGGGPHDSVAINLNLP
jgi:hypothetical protein